MDINDRRSVVGSGDFNNPKGTFSLTTHGYDQEAKWGQLSYAQARGEVHDYYKGQKDTKTWQEATRLAKRRTDYQFRGASANGREYADAYQEHLVRVMAGKGPKIADNLGELHHRQSGYGRV